MSKRILALLTAAIMLLPLAACGKAESVGSSSAAPDETPVSAFSVRDCDRVCCGAEGDQAVIGVRADGSVLCKYEDSGSYGNEQETARTSLTGIAAVIDQSYFLTEDGKILTFNNGKAVTVMSGAVGGFAAPYHLLGIKEDGRIEADLYEAGDGWSQLEGIADWTDIVSGAAGYNAAVGIRKDGTAVGAGSNKFGQLDVADWTELVYVSIYDSRGDLKNDTAVAFTLGVTKDGKVLIAGNPTEKMRNEIAALTDVKQIEADRNTCVVLKNDGTVCVLGTPEFYERVSGWTDITAFAFNAGNIMGLKSDGTAVFDSSTSYNKGALSGWLAGIDWKLN